MGKVWIFHKTKQKEERKRRHQNLFTQTCFLSMHVRFYILIICLSFLMTNDWKLQRKTMVCFGWNGTATEEFGMKKKVCFSLYVISVINRCFVQQVLQIQMELLR